MAARSLLIVGLDPEVKHRFQMQALKERRPMSDILREIIDAYLASKEA